MLHILQRGEATVASGCNKRVCPPCHAAGIKSRGRPASCGFAPTAFRSAGRIPRHSKAPGRLCRAPCQSSPRLPVTHSRLRLHKNSRARDWTICTTEKIRDRVAFGRRRGEQFLHRSIEAGISFIGRKRVEHTVETDGQRSPGQRPGNRECADIVDVSRSPHQWIACLSDDIALDQHGARYGRRDRCRGTRRERWWRGG